MLNRASTVRGAISLALNRKARSGGSGLWPSAALDASTTLAQSATHAIARALRRGRLGGDPIDIARQSIGDGDSDDLGKFVRVALPDGSLHARIKRGPRLDRHRRLARRFD